MSATTMQGPPSYFQGQLAVLAVTDPASPTRFPVIQAPIEGTFEERLNRFACRVRMEGQRTKVYLPNSGRLEELLRPGAMVLLEERRDRGKTKHDLLLVRTPAFPDRRPIWASLDSRLPPQLLAWSLRSGQATDFAQCRLVSKEPAVEEGRLDLLLESPAGPHYVETKSVNLVDRDGTARFPDAPTTRGRRHLETLIRLRQRGLAASVVFVVVREDALRFSPFVERDEAFASALREAERAGVGILAYQYRAGPQFDWLGPLAVDLNPPEFPGFWPRLEGRAEGPPVSASDLL